MYIKEYKLTEYYKLEELWNNLYAGKDMTPFQSYEWNSLLVEQFKGKYIRRLYRKLVFVCVFDNEECLLIAPLRIKKLVKKNIIKEIELLGADSFSDYVNLIYKANEEENLEEVFSFLFEYLRDKWKGYSLKWNDIPVDSKFGRYLLAKYNSSIVGYNKTVVIPINYSGFDDYFQNLSKSTRQNYRTACNRLNRDNKQLRFDILQGNISTELIDNLLQINLERTIEKNPERYSSIFSVLKEKYHLKHNNIMGNSMRKLSDIWVLVTYIDNDIAGFLIGRKVNDTIYVMMNKVSISSEFYSPMMISIIDGIKAYIGTDIKVFDFGRGTESYKYKLGGEDRSLLCLRYKL